MCYFSFIETYLDHLCYVLGFYEDFYEYSAILTLIYVL